MSLDVTTHFKLFSNNFFLDSGLGRGMYIHLLSLLSIASSKSQGLFVAAKMTTFLPESYWTIPSIWIKNCVLTFLELSCSSLPLPDKIESTSSIKIVVGE